MHLLGITFIRVVAMSVSTLNTPVIFLSEAIASALRTSSPSRLRLNLSSATASVALNIYLCWESVGDSGRWSVRCQSVTGQY